MQTPPPNPEEFTDEENAAELAIQEADFERMEPWFDDEPDEWLCPCDDDANNCMCGGFSGYPF